MHQYPKRILSIQDQIATYKNAGMIIPSDSEAEMVLTSIGYYRLRGYSSHLYNNCTKQYQPGTSLTDILTLYRFDTELSHILFSMTCSIEVALRARLIEALLIHNDALILFDSTVFDDKKRFWQNIGTLSSEVSRSNDVFIKHNFRNHEGEIPLWAAVEVMSFGTLSKMIKNLKTGSQSAYSILANHYKYTTQNGNSVKPSKDYMSSWIQAVSILRNICAHNSRIYNRSISTTPTILNADRVTPVPRFTGLYQIVMAMKYIRPTDAIWNEFKNDIENLFQKYQGCFDLNRMNFPPDWRNHFII